MKCCICELTRVEFFIRIQTSISPLPTASTSHLKWLRWWWWWYTMVMMMMMISHACFKVIRAFLLNENSCSTEFWFNHTIVRMGITARCVISLYKIIYFHTALWGIYQLCIYKWFGRYQIKDLNIPDWFYHHLFNNTSNHVNSENTGSELDIGKLNQPHLSLLISNFHVFTF